MKKIQQLILDRDSYLQVDLDVQGYNASYS